MANSNKDTAHFQVSLFLKSDISHSLNLDFKDVSILYIIAGYMDMCHSGICNARQTRLSKDTRVPLRTLVKHLKKLVALNILKKEKKGYLNHYQLGEVVDNYVQQWHLVHATTALDTCHSGTLYNKINNKIYNKESVFSVEKKDIPIYADVNGQSTSYIPVEPIIRSPVPDSIKQLLGLKRRNNG